MAGKGIIGVSAMRIGQRLREQLPAADRIAGVAQVFNGMEASSRIKSARGASAIIGAVTPKVAVSVALVVFSCSTARSMTGYKKMLACPVGLAGKSRWVGETSGTDIISGSAAVLYAHLLHYIQLRFQPVDMLFGISRIS